MSTIFAEILSDQNKAERLSHELKNVFGTSFPYWYRTLMAADFDLENELTLGFGILARLQDRVALLRLQMILNDEFKSDVRRHEKQIGKNLIPEVLHQELTTEAQSLEDSLFLPLLATLANEAVSTYLNANFGADAPLEN